jgi:hypothetical protein
LGQGDNSESTGGGLVQRASEGGVEPPEFKKWFGKSKVVDADGNPLVVYRGERGKEGSEGFQSRSGSLSFGSQQAASTYVMHPTDCRDQAQNPRVYPVYLSIQNPFINDGSDPFVDVSRIIEAVGEQKTHELLQRHESFLYSTDNWQENFADFDGIGAVIKEAPHRLKELYIDAFPLLDDSKFVADLKKAGYDGAIYGGSGETAMEFEYRVLNQPK